MAVQHRSCDIMNIVVHLLFIKVSQPRFAQLYLQRRMTCHARPRSSFSASGPARPDCAVRRQEPRGQRTFATPCDDPDSAQTSSGSLAGFFVSRLRQCRSQPIAIVEPDGQMLRRNFGYYVSVFQFTAYQAEGLSQDAGRSFHPCFA